MSSFKAYLTDAGAELLGQVVADGLQLEFVKMVIGSGEYGEGEKDREILKKRTRLKNQKQEFGFASILASGEGIVKLKAAISNKNVTEGYRITEIGIIARIKGTSDEGKLYSVAIANEADYLPAESTPITYIQEYITKIGNAEKVTIEIKEGTYALTEDIHRIEEKADTATAIAKGRNQAKVFDTTEDMYAWLADEANKGQYELATNLYIRDIGVPDWWISEVLEEQDEETGYYYHISQLETQKVDLTDVESEMAEIKKTADDSKELLSTLANKIGDNDISGIGDGTVTGAIASQNETFTNQIKSLAAHTHDDRYYTKSEVNALIEQIGTRLGLCLRYIGVYQQSITLAGNGEFFQEIPAEWQDGGYFYIANCSGNSLNFIANMEKYNIAVKNLSSNTLSTTVQVYCFSLGV